MADLEDRVVIRPHDCVWVDVVGRPFIVIELKVKHVAFQQGLDEDINFKDLGQVLEEQEGGRVVVLVGNDVVDDQLDSLHLVVLESIVNGRSVEVLVVLLEQTWV